MSDNLKVGGYFIGTCYDGKLIFNLLKNKKQGESIDLFDDGVKIWEINKDYSPTEFEDDASSIGYKINVYQESINKMFAEYLVNFDYLHRVMENYGFKLLPRDEAKNIGLPEGTGLFSELYNYMVDEIKRNPSKKNEYGTAMNMTAYERKISFLNRYFVYKKISNVNAEKIALDFIDETAGDEIAPSANASANAKEKAKDKTKGKEKVKETKPKIKKLNKKLVLVGAMESPILEEEKDVELEAAEQEVEKEEKVEIEPVVEPVPIPIAAPIPVQEKKPRKPRVVKPKLKILEE